jgi:hypothetical protein
MKVVHGAGKAAVVAILGVVGYRLVVSGELTLDTGVGRTVGPIGPIDIVIAAPRDVVFDVIAEPYLGRTPRAMGDKLEVLERGSDLVLAAHHTAVWPRIVATTVETVRFQRPATINFRLVRGPVPYLVERFMFVEHDGATRLSYSGELGTDFGRVGRGWGKLVARKWEKTVQASLDDVRHEAERRHATRR